MPGNTELTVATPASAKKVIAVGSYVTKNEWIDIDNIARIWKPTNQIGQRSDFSSIGPTRDGRILPNISAPGELMFSALSSHYTQVERAMILQGGGYQAQQGTSQAAPHVTGVIALMLQAEPDLSYEQIIQIFTQTARTDAQTGSVPNNYFGAGRIDAFAAVQSVITAVDEARDHRLPTAVTLSQNYPNPFNPESAIRYAIPFNGEVSVVIYDIQGRLVARLISGKQTAGEYTVRWDGRDSAGKRVASGVYLYRLEATSSSGVATTLTRKLTLLK
jgi:subtilisin family serine protease